MFVIKEQIKYVQTLMTQLEFPEDAQQNLMRALHCILENGKAAEAFSGIVGKYYETIDCPYTEMLNDAVALGEKLGIHEYTISLLMYLCMAEKLHSRYLEKGLPEQLYYDSIKDLLYKLNECRMVYGVDGSFVAFWFAGFYNFTRFALGRLQFEIKVLKKEFSVGGVDFPPESKTIATHIPLTGTKLHYEDVLDSYKRAAEMFGDQFPSGNIVFTCHSWLFDPWNFTVLNPNSNIAKFCNDFKVIATGNYEDYSQVWRIFNCQFTGDISKLPRDSSLRRAYAARMERGEPTAWGRGVFLYRDGKIYKD